MKKKYFYFLGIVLSFLFFSGISFAHSIPNVVKAKITNIKAPLSFEINKGQTSSAVKYLSRSKNHTLFLTKGEAILSLLSGAKKSTFVKIKLIGANKNPKISGLKKLPGKINYFIGNDPKKWQKNIPTYEKVKYENVYPGIDLVYYGNQEKLEYDLVVAAGVNAKTITLKFEGAKKLTLDKGGNLVLHTNGEKILQKKPIVYQEISGLKKEISGSYVLKANNKVGFKLGHYDTKRTLIIDPQLVYSTYLGGTENGSDEGFGITADSEGNAYVTGRVQSTGFPTTQGAFQTVTIGGSRDSAFVTKFSPTGTLIYSTYLGGSQNIGDETGKAIKVDGSGNAYVLGETRESSFPITSGALQTTVKNGNIEAFIAKLNPSGSALIYSTFLGSNENDRANDIVIDTSGNAYVTGLTTDFSFPTTQGAFQATVMSGSNAFVSKINPTGTALVYSTFLGGTHIDEGYGIDVDSSGNAYVAGLTRSSDFPVTPGVIKTTNTAAIYDVFISKLNPSGTGLIYSTYLGGSGQETTLDGTLTFFQLGAEGVDVDVDESGNAYVTGSTQSNDFPTTNGAFQTFNKGRVDSFITKLNPTATSILYSTYLGTAGDDGTIGISTDNSGNIYVIGNTTAAPFAFPTTPDSLIIISGSGPSCFVSVLDQTKTGGDSLIYSTIISTSSVGKTIALDSLNNIYVTGKASSANFPTLNPIQSTLKGIHDAFVAKISAVVEPTTTTASPTPTPSGPGTGPADKAAAEAQIKKAVKNLSKASKKLGRSSKPGRELKKELITTLKTIKSTIGTGSGCEESIESLVDEVVLVLEKAISKSCESPPSRANLKAIVSISNCIPQAAIDEFTEVVDKSTDEILAALEIDEDEDFNADVCQE